MDDQVELGVAIALVVGAQVADVLGSAERRAGLLQQQDGVIAVWRDVTSADVEDVKAFLVGRKFDVDVHVRVRHARGELCRRGC